jgi:hypothetical protein
MCGSASAGDYTLVEPVPAIEQRETFSAEVRFAWDAKYVTEGRDNLEDGGLASAGLDLFMGGAVATIWHADSLDTGYAETNLSVGCDWALHGFEFSASYTWLYFSEDSTDDHEIGIGMAYPLWEGLLMPGISGVWGAESRGAFFEFTVASEVAIGAADSDPSWMLLPAVTLGWDAGYASDDLNGANHVHLHLGVEHVLSECVTVGCYMAHSIALDDVRADGGSNVSYGGFYLCCRF